MENNKNTNIVNFNRRRDLLLRRKKEVEDLLAASIDSYNKISKSILPRKEIKLSAIENIIQLREKNLKAIDTELEYIRPRNEEDIAYRERQYKDFSKFIKENIPDNLPLLFHGSPINASKEIILSGEISSYGDRVDSEIIYDTPGKIYVNTRDNIFDSVRNFCNLTYDYDLPAGCLFVVTPKDIQDEMTGHNQTMKSVYFKEDPERLVAVISTPENMGNLKDWMIKSGLSSEKVFSYDDFTNNINKIIDSVVIPYRDNKASKMNRSFESMIKSAEKRAGVNNERKAYAKEVTAVERE